MLRKLMIVVVVLLIAGGAIVAYEWYKPHPKPASSGIAITSEALAKEYSADEKASDAKYLDKTLEVSGAVSNVSKNQDSSVVITLATGDPMAETQCTMNDKNATATKGQNVTVVGFCKGNNMGVVLTDCHLK